MLRRRHDALACWLYVGMNVPLVVAVFLLPHYHVYLWGLLGMGSAGAIVAGLVRNKPADRRAWILVALAVATFASGDITYDVLTEFLHQSNPFPSVADAFYLSTFPLLVLGLVSMVRARRRRNGDTGALLDSLIVTAGCGVVSWVYLIHPYVRAADLTLPVRLTSVAYPVGDILILCVLARLVFAGGTSNASVRLMTAGALGLLAADVVYGWIQLYGSWKVGGPTDLGWVLFYVCWGAAALHPAMRQMTVEQPRQVRHLRPGTLVLLSATTLLAPGVIVWRDVVGTPNDAGDLAAASAVVFVLVMLRMTGLARAQAMYARREQELRGFTERLVAATERADVWAAAVEAVVAIAAGGVTGCVVTDTDGPGAKIVAGTWTDAVGVAVDVAAVGPGDHRMVRVADGGSLPATSPATVWTRLELSERDGAREQMLLAHDRPLSVALLEILEAVGAQLILALGRVELADVLHEARTERKFQSMVQHSSDLLTLLDADGRVVYQSPAVGAVLGRRPDALIGKSLNLLLHPDDLLTAQAQLTKVLAGGLGTSFTFECRVAHADGEWRTVDTVMTNLIDDPSVGAIVLNSRDVTERRALELQLNLQAFYDPLTGLANRALFLDRLSHAMDRGHRQADPVAVLFLDVDDFKNVNDSLGHPAGDELLAAVAERLRSATRPGDTVARFGGDEFAVLVESGTMPEAAEVVAERIAEELKPTFRIQDNDLAVRASIGIALGQRPQEKPDDLLRDADLAMYMAKRNGKGRFEMYRPDMHQDAVHRLETAAALRRGLEVGQLEAFYQPIVNTHTGRLVGVEALARWHHPTRGMVAPVEFIPIAEATGLIVPLGRQVLREATRQTQAWRRDGVVDDQFYVSVNLSARQLHDPDLIGDVSRALADSGLPPAALVLEVTESSLVKDLDTTLPLLHALRDLGLRLAVDDFGTGYSSLSYLADLPVSVVKIDKSFIDRVTHDAEGAAMVRGVIDLSHALGLTCIAEGVEHENQLAVLDDLGCDSIQGYFFARPTSSAEVAGILRRLRVGQSASAVPATMAS